MVERRKMIPTINIHNYYLLLSAVTVLDNVELVPISTRRLERCLHGQVKGNQTVTKRDLLTSIYKSATPTSSSATSTT